MRAIQIEEDIGDQLGSSQVPTLMALRRLPRPIAFSRLRSNAIDREPPKQASPDAAFVLLVAIAPIAPGKLWIERNHGALTAASSGETFVFDLSACPIVSFAGAYDFVRFYLPAVTLDRLADEQGVPRVRTLRTAPPQVRDPVMQGLALSLLPVLNAPHAAAIRFLDSIALAFHDHVMRSYGGAPASGPDASRGLAAWQLRRVRAFAEADVDALPSVTELARECRLSPSHFARRFSASTGTSPHQWLTTRRVERAKELLLGSGHELSQIALACGFVDQSHFTRVFTRIEGQSPGRWRRQHRR